MTDAPFPIMQVMLDLQLEVLVDCLTMRHNLMMHRSSWSNDVISMIMIFDLDIWAFLAASPQQRTYLQCTQRKLLGQQPISSRPSSVWRDTSWPLHHNNAPAHSALSVGSSCLLDLLKNHSLTIHLIHPRSCTDHVSYGSSQC